MNEGTKILKKEKRLEVALRILRGETIESAVYDLGVTRERGRQYLNAAVRMVAPDRHRSYIEGASRERGNRWIDRVRADADYLIPRIEKKLKELQG